MSANFYDFQRKSNLTIEINLLHGTTNNRDSVQEETVPKRISRAYKLGRTAKKVTTCQEKFYMCPYSGKTMLTIIDLQSRLMG